MICIFASGRNKKPPQSLCFETGEYYYTRGTTQIAEQAPPLFDAKQHLCRNVAFTGSAYRVTDLWDFRLGSDGNAAVFYRDRTIPDSLRKHFAASLLFFVVRILARVFCVVNIFFKI